MENLNAEQIKKALTVHSHIKHPTMVDCSACAYIWSESCQEVLATDALALITSQEQRIGELTEESERLQKALNTDISFVRVCRGSGKTAHLREVGRIKADAIRADTVRKMQERLNREALIDRGYEVLLEGTIDQIAKEMLEGNDDNT